MDKELRKEPHKWADSVENEVKLAMIFGLFLMALIVGVSLLVFQTSERIAKLEAVVEYEQKKQWLYSAKPEHCLNEEYVLSENERLACLDEYNRNNDTPPTGY